MKYIHNTNITNDLSPVGGSSLSSQIDVGEIAINAWAGQAFNEPKRSPGRLYIKLTDNTVVKFVALADNQAYKTIYGGTNNIFSSVSDNADTNADSLMVFRVDPANSDHTIDKTVANRLTWNSGLGRLGINLHDPSMAATASLHLKGDCILNGLNVFDTDRTTYSDTNGFDIVLQGLVSKRLYTVPSGDFLNRFTIGTTSDPLTPIGVLAGNSGIYKMQYSYDQNLLSTSGPTFSGISLTTLSNGTSTLPVLGIDTATNKVVKLESLENTKIKNLSVSGVVASGSVLLSEVKNFDLYSSNVTALGINNSTGAIINIGHRINQNLRTDSNVNFLGLYASGDIFMSGLTDITDIPNTENISLVCVDTSSQQISRTNILANINLPDYSTAPATDENSDPNTLYYVYYTEMSGVFYKGPTTYSTSSYKVKENIQNYTPGLSETLQLQPVLFNYKNDANKKQQLGLIAEELDTLGLNSLVMYNSNNEPYGIHYEKLAVLLVNAIKELNDKIDQK
jgi:hypothetical protein